MIDAEHKRKLVDELIELHEKLDVARLYGFPNQKDTQQWLADVASVLKNLDENDYQEIVRLSKTVGLSGDREERKKAAQEISQFLGRKVAEYKRHDFSQVENPFPSSKTFPKLMLGETGSAGKPGGGGSIFLYGQNIHISNTARISADGGDVINTTHGNNSPININLGEINNTIEKFESEFENNYHGSNKAEIKGILKELKMEAAQGNEGKFKKVVGTLLTHGAEIAQIASFAAQLLTLSSTPK